MIEALIDKYIKELKYKISLKMIPNKTEEQILYQNFKYFDMEGSGFCNLRDFMKANDKVGVVLNRVQDIEEIFKYFDFDQCGVIDYRNFCNSIFAIKELQLPSYQRNNLQRNISNLSPNQGTANWKKKPHGPFFDKLCNILIQNGGANALITLNNECKNVDINSTGRLTIDDFIKIVTGNKINLSISDIQKWFHSYELSNNGLFFYEEMFKDLKGLFWNTKRGQFITEIYNRITQNNHSILVNDLRQMFEPKVHPAANEYSLNKLMEEYQLFVDAFLIVKRLTRGNFGLTKGDLEDFFKFYSFGIENDAEFFDIISNCFYVNVNDTKQEGEYQYGKDMRFSKEINNKSNARSTTPQRQNAQNCQPYQKNNRDQFIPASQANQWTDYNGTNLNEITRPRNTGAINHTNNQISSIIIKLQSSLQKFGLKTVFSLIKHFKYYDNGTKFITKYDFAKVLKDFRLNLTVNEIERVFDYFCSDIKKVELNYDTFFSSLTSNNLTESRKEEINIIFNKFENYLRTIGARWTIDLLKTMYSPKGNIFGLDESAALNEFCDNFDLYHYTVKENKTAYVTYDEFYEFYKIVSFVIERDVDFIKLINNEWVKLGKSPNIQGQRGNNNQEYSYNNISPSYEMNIINAGNNNNINNKPYLLNWKGNGTEIPERPLTPNIKANNFGDNQDLRHTPNREKSAKKTQFENKYNPYKQNIQDPLQKVKIHLKRRGIRGLMNLHKQFLYSCPELDCIKMNEFYKVLLLQRLELTKQESSQLFTTYCQEENNEYLNFPRFIRVFKQVLNESRLSVVEKCFGFLDLEQTGNLFLDDIKTSFIPNQHPEIIKRIKNEDEIVTEFIDCFDLNYNWLTSPDNPDTGNMVSFEEFANFYEYVSFLYDSDKDFISWVEGSWLR